MAAAAVVAASLMLTPTPALASGLESIDILDNVGALDVPRGAVEQAKKLAEVDAAFQQSDTLKQLLAKSEANKAKNAKAIADKYCYRQAELGIGDCGGLRLLPGMTESGKQKTPKWLADLLGVQVPDDYYEEGPSLKDFFKDGVPE